MSLRVAQPARGPASGRLRERLASASEGLGWQALVTVPASLILAALIVKSTRGAIAWAIIVVIVGLHAHRRQWGLYALFAFWVLSPELRRVLDELSGYQGSDPLSLAPFLATGVLALIEFHQHRVAVTVRRVMLLALGGLVIGLPLGVTHPTSGLYALVAYGCGVAALVLGANEQGGLANDTFRRFLIYGVPPIALYGVLFQKILPYTSWDKAWISTSHFSSLGANSTGQVRLFGTVNAPGTLAPLLGLALLAYLTVHPPRGWQRWLAIASATVIAVALELTLVRSSWLALPVAAIAHVVATRGRSARVVFGVAAATIALTLALSPVSPAAHSVVNRAATFSHLGGDVSVNARSSTLNTSFPGAARAPLGRGLGTAGQPSQLNTSQADLAIPDDGYLSMLYQVGPVGFLLVAAALLAVTAAAWRAARSRAAPEEGALLFAMLVFMLVVLGSGDAFYGLGGLTMWFVGGRALRLAPERAPSVATAPAAVGTLPRARS